MKKKRFTKEQIIAILKEHEAGIKIPELSRQHGVSVQSIYRWKAKYRRFVAFVHSTSKFVGGCPSFGQQILLRYSYGVGCLNQHWFRSIEEARDSIDQWRHYYNHVRPHGSLNYLPPVAFVNRAA